MRTKPDAEHPFREGETVKTPTGRIAEVTGYDHEGRAELKYKESEVVVVWPRYLIKTRAR